jgi:hypothetical protein
MNWSSLRLAVLLAGLSVAHACAIDPVPTPGTGDVAYQNGDHDDVGSIKGSEDAALGAGDAAAPNGCPCAEQGAGGYWCDSGVDGGEVQCHCECEVEGAECQEVVEQGPGTEL